MRSFIIACALALSLSANAHAQMHQPLYTHAMNTKPGVDSTPGYEAAMDKMHQNMDIDYSGNADVDFVRGMIPHHQGAIDMAKVELAHGKDPKVRKLAQNIIHAQEREIAMMQKWLADHDIKAGHGHAPH